MGSIPSPVIHESDIENPREIELVTEAYVACQRNLASLHALVYPTYSSRLLALQLRANACLDSATDCLERQYGLNHMLKRYKQLLLPIYAFTLFLLFSTLVSAQAPWLPLDVSQLFGLLASGLCALILVEARINRLDLTYESLESTLTQTQTTLRSLNISDALMVQYARTHADPKKLGELNLAVWGEHGAIREKYISWVDTSIKRELKFIQKYIVDVRLIRLISPDTKVLIPEALDRITVSI